MSPEPTPCQRVLLRLLPAHLRDCTWGDLIETAPGAPRSGWLTRELTGIVLHAQAEPWRDAATAWRALLLLAAAAGLLWLLPRASASLLAQAAVFGDGVGHALLSPWRAEGAVASLAAGLLLGRASVLPEHGTPLRLQGALVLAAAQASLAGWLPALLLLGAGWLGHRHRVLR